MPASDAAPQGLSHFLSDRFGFRRRAEKLARDPQKVGGLAGRARAKLASVRGALGSLREDLPILLRFAKAWADGRYRTIPWKSLVLIVTAILYFVSPLDAVPDWIPALGFLDDAAVVTYVLRAVRGDLDKFEAWETNA